MLAYRPGGYPLLSNTYRNHENIPYKVTRSPRRSAFYGKRRTFNGIIDLVYHKFLLIALCMHVQVPLLFVHERLFVDHVVLVLILHELTFRQRQLRGHRYRQILYTSNTFYVK